MQLRKLWELQPPCVVISRLHFHLPESSHAPDRHLISISHAVRPSNTPPKGCGSSSRGQFPGESHQPLPGSVKWLKAGLINFSVLILHSPLRISGLGIDLLVLYFFTIQISFNAWQKSHLDLEVTVRL